MCLFDFIAEASRNGQIEFATFSGRTWFPQFSTIRLTNLDYARTPQPTETAADHNFGFAVNKKAAPRRVRPARNASRHLDRIVVSHLC